MKRQYQHVQELLPIVKELLASGKTQKEVEAVLGLTGNRPVHQLLMREQRKEKKIEAGIMLRPKGRPRKDALPKDIVAEQAYEIRRLRMENELLRDFLSVTGKE